MVRIAAPFLFLLTLFVSTISTPPPLESDLDAIETQVMKLQSGVNAFPVPTGGTLAEALTIHDDILAIIPLIQAATADCLANGSIDSADSTTIVNILTTISNELEEIAEGLQERATEINGLGVAGLGALLLSDMQNLESNITALDNCLGINVTPPLQPQVEELAASVENALADAEAAY